MKRTLLPFFAAILLGGTATAQCTFDSQYAGQGPGMYPAVLDPVLTCVGCGDHTRSVSLITNTFMNVANPTSPGNFITLYIDATKLLSIEGQPAGTSFGTDLGAAPNLGVWLNTGTVPNQVSTTGCSYVTGDEAAWNAAIGGGPNSDGVYPLIITVDARINSSSPDVSQFVPNGTWATAVSPSLGGGPIIFDTYQIVVQEDGTVGIQERGSSVSVYPNPTADVLRIDLGSHSNAVAELFNMQGVRVVQAQLAQGVSVLQTAAVAEGIYICRVSDPAGQLLLTERVAVAR
ncbi:MAG: T9SS type A sorting domain-containing protein [Flavobacteriales bacterium]|nr:T9SS type A sorting domain-containing protein [Flavobacteriales bacterium]